MGGGLLRGSPLGQEGRGQGLSGGHWVKEAKGAGMEGSSEWLRAGEGSTSASGSGGAPNLSLCLEGPTCDLREDS